MGRKKKKRSAKTVDTVKSNDSQSSCTTIQRSDQMTKEEEKEKEKTFQIEVKPNINITQKISGNVQMGKDNTMQIIQHDFSDDELGTGEGACALPTTDIKKSFPQGRKSYAEVCTSNRGEPLQIVHTTNITIQNTPKDECHSTEPKYKQIRNFLESVEDFKNGHFILILDKYEHVNNLEALSSVPWITVLDFDPNSRSSGILSCTELKLSKMRSLHIGSIQDKTSISEERTNWIFMAGCSDRPDTRMSEDFKSWKAEVNEHYRTHLEQLKKFGQAYTTFTLIVIWPRDSSKWRHIQYTVDKAAKILSSPIVLIDDGHKKNPREESCLECLEEDHTVKTIELSLRDICKVLAAHFRQDMGNYSGNYQLPSQTDPEITEEKAKWLSEDLEVLYVENKTGQMYSQEELQQEEDNFFKGGTLPWAWWYRVGSGHLDVARDVMQSVLTYIKTNHVELAKSGVVTLYHAPGSGGTTLAQRILWEMRKDIPCAQVKHRSWVSVSELSDKIGFLSDKTRTPILILIDGEDEQRVDSIQRALKEYCIIILYVKRSPYRIKETEHVFGRFWLKSNISKNEAAILGLKYEKQCSTLKKTEAIQKLVREVEKGSSYSFFDFGLTVHDHEYKGLESYVRGYLRLEENKSKELQHWQTALAYLSLVYYYGQTSLPCFFLSEVLHSSKILLIDELPKEMTEFIVKDFNDGKKNVVRISHYLVAKEILDQVLTRFVRCERPMAPFICNKAKHLLGKFAIQFIKLSGEINKGSASTMICKTMTKTFITRDNKAVGESETQANRKRAKVSQILEDVDSRSPYTERFGVLQQLTDSFPKEPQFRAHLGRLFTICRPEEEEKAEKCFKLALEMCLREVEGMHIDDIPYTKKLDLRNIYHMYGNMFILKIANYTGKYLGDTPRINTETSHFYETGMSLLERVHQACNLFLKCREITPPGSEESFGYIGEIQVRLMFCDYVNSLSGCSNLHQYAAENKTDIAAFVEDCYVALDELFIECFSVIEPEKMDNTVQNCQEWFAAIFNAPISRAKSSRDDIQSRRMEIAKVKMKYSTSKAYGVLELINNRSDICFIVDGYEKNFEVYDRLDSQHQLDLMEKRPTTRAIDMDYREWLFAIRHRLFPKEYQIEDVLQHVQCWYDGLHTPYARFYLFVLKSLLGIGYYNRTGNTQVLLQAQNLKDEVLKHSKYMAKPKYPREWLGPETTTIRRLAQGKRFFGQIEGKDIHGVDLSSLEIRKGTICPPNDKPAGGFIDLDLGPENRVPVKVFFIPARSEMKGVSYQGTRVEFVIGFSLSHGYEAFSVKPLIQITCEKCTRKVEARSCDTIVKCHGCLVENVVKSNPRLAKTARLNGNKE